MNTITGEDKKLFVASIRVSGQITENEYTAWTETKVCTRETTIGEIEDWFRINSSRKNSKLYCNISEAS